MQSYWMIAMNEKQKLSLMIYQSVPQKVFCGTIAQG